MKALVAELGGTGADGNPVRAFYLGKELNFYLHYENSIPILVKASANSGNIIRLTRVVELKIYGVVHVPELVNVVETYLQRHHIVKLVISFFCHLIKPNLYKSATKLHNKKQKSVKTLRFSLFWRKNCFKSKLFRTKIPQLQKNVVTLYRNSETK